LCLLLEMANMRAQWRADFRRKERVWLTQIDARKRH
jgi:hypothetical protein